MVTEPGARRCGTPQGGVVSPLLANLYMNRFLKHWRTSGRGIAYRAHIVAYADDFVILSRGHAAEPPRRGPQRVEIAATAFANLLHGETLVGPPGWARTILVLVLGCAFMLASCPGTAWRGSVATFALAAAYGAVASLVCGLAAVAAGRCPLLGLLPACHWPWPGHSLSGCRALARRLRARQVSQHLLKAGGFAAARPQRRELTIMLTDIVGFTTLAERATPEAVTAFVNRHFTMLTHCVEAEGGVVGQFTGDSVMAFWGAPDPRPDHAARACRTALAIAAALKAENGQRQTRGEPRSGCASGSTPAR